MKLSMLDWSVLNGIPYGADTPVTTSELCKLTGLEIREVRQAISILVNRYGVPIVASRSGNRGLYIATNEAERAAGLIAFTSQVTNMKLRIDAIKAADLNHWKDDLEPEIRVIHQRKSEHVG